MLCRGLPGAIAQGALPPAVEPRLLRRRPGAGRVQGTAPLYSLHGRAGLALTGITTWRARCRLTARPPSDRPPALRPPPCTFRAQNEGAWFKGTVAAVNGDGTYVVRYEDGDEEQGVEARRILTVAVPRSEVRRGQTVTANYKLEGKYFRGVIAHINGNGTVNIEYEDGDKEHGVAR